MYEDRTHDAILEELMAVAPGGVSVYEGSVLYNTLSAWAFEMEKGYIALDNILKQTYALTADYEFLELRAIENGLSPYPATFCKSRGEFNIEIPEGTKFSIGKYVFTSGERLESEYNFAYIMTCEAAGTSANGVHGTLSLSEMITDFNADELSYAEITETLIPARDKELQGNFLIRYLESFATQSFGGNQRDYRDKVHTIEGVGGVQIYRANTSGGIVKVVITDSENNKASQLIIDLVKNTMDPDEFEGEGLGLAPIGHIVQVESAQEVSITVETTLTFDAYHTRETIEPLVNAAIEDYFAILRSSWESEYIRKRNPDENLIVRVAEIESRILAIEGIIDVQNTTLNSTPNNVILKSVEIPILEEVIF